MKGLDNDRKDPEHPPDEVQHRGRPRRSARLRSRRWFAVLAGVLGLAAILGMRMSSRLFLFPDIRARSTTYPEGFIALRLAATDGVAVNALELAGPPDARVVVHFHNNRETMGDSVDLARTLHTAGFGVVLTEYRGYGVSKGAEPTEDGLYRDAEAVLDALARRGVERRRIVLWGASLGTGVAAEMARRGRGAALVLFAPYTSIPDVVTDTVPVVPGRLLVRDRFDTLAKAAEIRVPTLIVHGDADEIIPFWMGQRLAKAIPGARLVRIGRGRHGDLFAREGEALVGEVESLPARL